MINAHHARLDSTHAQARRHVRRIQIDQPMLVTADQQSDARNRDGGTWHAPVGGSWFTLAWPTRLPAQTAQAVALFASYAALRSSRRAISLTPDGCTCSLEIKWPNDLLIDGKKVASTLVEVIEQPVGDQPRVMLITVGINVNMPLDQLPQDPALGATTLAHAAGGELDSADLTQATVFDLTQLLQNAECNGQAQGILKAIECRLAWIGDPVSVIHGGERIEGICRSLDSLGRLQIDTTEGIRTFAAGEVERLRPMDYLDTWFGLCAHLPTFDAIR